MDLNLEWAKLVGGWIFSWPAAVVVVSFTLKQQIARWLETVTGLKAGPVKITRQLQAVAEAGQSTLDSVSQMIVLLGESRLTELQVTLKTVGAVFPKEDVKKMREQIAAMEALLEKVKTPRRKSTNSRRLPPPSAAQSDQSQAHEAL